MSNFNLFEIFLSEFVKHGIPKENAEISLFEDSRWLKNNLFLKTYAFKPTGVAIGCPLPFNVQKTFSTVCDQIDYFLKSEFLLKSPVISRVPPNYYHITLVNRTHFSLKGAKNKVHPLNSHEKSQVDHIVQQSNFCPIIINYQGLLINKEGRLLIPAYPINNNIENLKIALRDGVVDGRKKQPVFKQHFSILLWTKLAHIVVPIEQSKALQLLQFIQKIGSEINFKIEFHDVYTQRGRVSFK